MVECSDYVQPNGALAADDVTTRRLTSVIVKRDGSCDSSRPHVLRLACDSFGHAVDDECAHATGIARRLRLEGADSVLVLGVKAQYEYLHWLDSHNASGWIRLASGKCSSPDPSSVVALLEQALALGHADADAALIAIVDACQPTTTGHWPDLPQLSWAETPRFSGLVPPRTDPALGLYAIVDSSANAQRILDAGVRTIQLRIKRPVTPPPDWDASLRREIELTVALADSAGATLFINDAWELARECGARGVHLGQEDLLGLGEMNRARLLESGLALGVSSHSIWELCRARALAPRYIACGPVWPTTTKTLPWVPQGEDNLRWWCRVAGAPVVAIGGVLGPLEVERAAACGADGVCLVRGLANDPERAVPPLTVALERGRDASRPALRRWPHPTLPNTGAVGLAAAG